MRAYLQLVRAGALFSPAADVVAGMALNGDLHGHLWTDVGVAVRACVASVLVYAAGMALNDHADRDIDRQVRPERPIPRGAVTPGQALTFGLALLVAGVALSPVPHWHGVLAVLVLAYDYGVRNRWLGERWAGAPVLGAVTMGALRGLNLLTGSCLHPDSPWPPLAPPVDDGGTGMGLIYASTAYAVGIVAVTLLGVLEDHRTVRPRAVVALLNIAPLAWFLGVLGTARDGGVALAAATLAVVAFGMRNRRITTWDAPAIRGAMFWLLLGTALYSALLCAGQERWPEAAVILATIPLARWIGRTIRPT